MTEKKKQLTCIVCPAGCRVSVRTQDEGFVCSGNRCPKGELFAVKELTAPMRSLTTTVRTVFPETPVLPVRTDGEIPKESIPAVMLKLSKILVTERIGIGAAVVGSMPEIGCSIIATSDMLTQNA